MSDAKSGKKPGKLKTILLIGLAVVVIGGGGVGAGLYASGAIGAGKSVHVDPNKPQLVPRDGVDESVVARFASTSGDGSPDPALFKASYYPLGEQFTVNLKDSDGFAQIGIGVSTYYDERALANVKLHEMAVRSAVLLALSEQDIATISAPEGKVALKRNLKKAINDALKAREGFGGIDDVYFTSFVVQ